MRFNLLLALAALAAAPVLAQNAPAPAAPAAATPDISDVDVPKHTCAKPGEFPGALSSDRQQREYQKEFVAYTDCLKKFALEQQKIAQPHVKAANATVDEYNKAVAAYNADVEKLKANK
jgi:hypothetical protein